MANTYYNSQLTAAEIEAALEAIDGVIVPANNGKVLTINNGKLEARSVQWGGGEPVLEPLSVTANGDYTPEAGVDGFDEVHVSVPNSYSASDEGKVVSNGALVAQTARASQITQNGTYDTTLNDEVTVNVSGGGGAVVQPLSVTQNGTYNPPSGVDGYAPVTVNVSGGGGSNAIIRDASIITASDIVTEFEAFLGIQSGSAVDLQEVGAHDNERFYRTSPTNILFADLEDSNTSATIYSVIRSKISTGDFGGIVFCHNWYNGTAPMFYTRSNTWLTGVYGSDLSTGISSNVFRVLALAVNGTTKIASYYIGGEKIRDNVSFTTSGRHGSWGGGYSYQNVVQAANVFDVLYGAVVRGVETEAEIIANCQAIATAYSSYIGT